MLPSRYTLALLATTALAGLGSAGTAQAQAGKEIELDEITVTARKRDERLRDVPFTVDVQSRKQLEENHVTDAPSALREVAGAAVTTFGDRNSSFIVMRGVGPVLFPLSADDSSVLTFVDGAPLPISSSNAGYLDLERVEVLKGPQSTLFGRNTSGGAINLIPVMPDETWKGYLKSELGSGGHRLLEGAVGGPLVKDVLSARIAFRLRGADGYINNVAGPQLGAEKGGSGRATFVFTPTEQTKWTISVGAESVDNVPAYYMLKGDGFPVIAAQNLAREVVKAYSAQSKLEHKFERMTLTAQTSYTANRADTSYNASDCFLGGRISGLGFSDLSNKAFNFYDITGRQARFTQELRLSSHPGQPLQWVAGASYYRDTASLLANKNSVLYGPFVAGHDRFNQTTTGQAVFGEASYPVLDRLKLSLGGRYTFEQKSYDAAFSGDGVPDTVAHFNERGKKDYGFWAGRASLSYDWSDELTTYATISRGFKSGGFGTFNSLMFAGVPRVPYDSTSMVTYEAGARAGLLDNRLKLSAALFFNDVSKEQILAYDLRSFSWNSLNIDTQSYGVEVDGTYRLSDNWEVGGGLAYTDTSLGRVSARAAATQQGLKNGNQVPYVPQWAGKAAITYRAPLGTLGLTEWGSASLLARVGYNYIGSRYSDAGNQAKLPPVHLVSARLGLSWEKGEVYLFGENLLDKRYTLFAQPFGTSVVSGAPVFGATYARGATLGAGASLKF